MNWDLWTEIGFDFLKDAIAEESRRSVGSFFRDHREGSPKSPVLSQGARKDFIEGGWLDLADRSADSPGRDDILLDIARLAGFHRVPLPIPGLVVATALARSMQVEVDLLVATGACLDAGFGWRSGDLIFGLPIFDGAEVAVVVESGTATVMSLRGAVVPAPADHSMRVAQVRASDAVVGQSTIEPEVHEWLVRIVPVLVAADAVGAAERGWASARTHVLTRSQFGRKLAEQQAVRFQLASGAASIVAARALLGQLCAPEGIGQFGNSTRTVAAVDLILSHAEEAVIGATHVHGALGYTAAEEVGWCRMRVAAARALLRRSSRELRSLA